jgi:hypothetical protein
LFLDRGRAADPGFVADPAEVAEICARLDGMPLAIELAAARGAALGADGLLSALDDQLRLLSGGRGGDERHRSLRAVLGWSHDLLDPEEQQLFRCLAVFAAGFDLDAVVAVSAGTRAWAADLVGRLVDKSMVGPVPGAVGRWRLLERCGPLPPSAWPRARMPQGWPSGIWRGRPRWPSSWSAGWAKRTTGTTPSTPWPTTFVRRWPPRHRVRARRRTGSPARWGT